MAVGAIVAGWALAQQPQLLPGLTVEQAAAGDATMVALLVSLAIGARDPDPVARRCCSGSCCAGASTSARASPARSSALGEARPRRGRARRSPGRPPPASRLPSAPALGVPLTFLSDGGAALALGVVLLLAAVAAAAVFVVPQVALDGDADGR